MSSLTSSNIYNIPESFNGIDSSFFAIRYLKQSIDLHATIIFWDEYVGFVSGRDNYSVLIRSQDISSTLRSIFEIFWEQGKEK